MQPCPAPDYYSLDIGTEIVLALGVSVEGGDVLGLDMRVLVGLAYQTRIGLWPCLLLLLHGIVIS